VGVLIKALGELIQKTNKVLKYLNPVGESEKKEKHLGERKCGLSTCENVIPRGIRTKGGGIQMIRQSITMHLRPEER